MNNPRSATLELLSSMRFAVCLLTIIAVASTIGTVLKQNEPYSNYLQQFGPFWFPVFEKLGLYSVYSAWWFLVILGFLVVSTSLCLWRNAPMMLRETRRFQDALREKAFDNFSQRASFVTVHPRELASARLAEYLRSEGFSLRLVQREESTLIAAQAGLHRRWGYVFAHAAIVLICLGGLADSEALLKLQLFTGSKKPVNGNMRLADVPAESRLSAGNFSFRGNMMVPEGRSADQAVLAVGDGLLVQELPFSLSLKKFIIEHYSTGQPRLFASEVMVTDKESGESFDARIEVNKPLVYRGVTVYQASFDDGGTLVKLLARNMAGGAENPRVIEARVGDTLPLEFGGAGYQLEMTAFRPFNIENQATEQPAAPDAAASSLASRMRAGLGAAARPDAHKEVRNVGPSFQYKLRDASGQAREYHNYMLPLQVDQHWYMMTGMRSVPSDAFRYLRIPLDDAGSLAEFSRLRNALFDASLRRDIAKRFLAGAAGAQEMSETVRTRLDETVMRVLDTFGRKGFQSVAEFLDKAVPEAERETAAGIYLRVLQGAAWEAWMIARERAGLKRLEPTAGHARFVQDSLSAVSDTFFYGVPLYLQMSGYEEVKASVFQLTRSPGKNIVYSGCALLVLGIFAMFYVRERRLWLLVKDSGEVKFAFSPNRGTLDMNEEFERHRNMLPRILT